MASTTTAGAPKQVVDRSIHAILPSPDADDGGQSSSASPRSTPSALEGVAPSTERLHRLQCHIVIIVDVAQLKRHRNRRLRRAEY